MKINVFAHYNSLIQIKAAVDAYKQGDTTLTGSMRTPADGDQFLADDLFLEGHQVKENVICVKEFFPIP